MVSTTLAITGKAGHGDGAGPTAQFNNPNGVAVDREGNVILADTGNNLIRKISPQGWAAVKKGTPVGVVYRAQGPALGSWKDPPPAAYVCARCVTVSTLAGTGEVGYHQDGEGTAAQFNGPTGLAVDREGNVFVADLNNNRIRKISPQGLVSTLAGTDEWGHRDGEGAAAQFNSPTGVATGMAMSLWPTGTTIVSAGYRRRAAWFLHWWALARKARLYE
eukprot:1187205-Prorocentrum_minimum.AAC.5